MRFLGPITIVVALAGCADAPPVTRAATDSTAVGAASATTRINAPRRAAGLPALARSGALDAAARAHAADMERNGFFGHRGSDGRGHGQRIRGAGYRHCYASENIAQGVGGPRTVLGAWLDSPGHRRNLLSPKATEYGLAQRGASWVAVFARPC